MKRRNETRRSGVVLLLILGLMSMFALSVLTYMIVTSNMAETAQNSAKLDAVVEVPAQADVGAALKTLVVGSNNERNPIGPFSILENMYGDWTEVYASNNVTYQNSAEYYARLALFPNLGFAILTPCDDVGDVLSYNNMLDLFKNSGGVVTFQGADNFPDEDSEELWNDVVSNSSAFVLEKVITNPVGPTYKNIGSQSSSAGEYWAEHYFDNLTANTGNQKYYWACDSWHLKVEMTDDLKRFVDDFCNIDYNANYNQNKFDYSSIESNFNINGPTVCFRMNRPAYSGTGAGGFTPGEAKDAQVTPDMANNLENYSASDYRIPFAFWGNAAAPDLYPYYRTESSKLSFRTYWAHLLDVNYDSSWQDYNGFRYAYWENGAWNSHNPVSFGYSDGASLEPVYMNSSYTAPDFRTMFLAHFGGSVRVNSDNSLPEITPSFHRPDLFKTLVDGGYFGYYEGLYGEAGLGSDAMQPLLASLVRKLTPRPLPVDHWKFDGGNTYLDFYNGSSGEMTAQELAQRLSGGTNYQWDVDNDGDGVREGIWVPSGLPVRVDKNGTPYATMFSYTVLDLDGRINVNTAGNWDQLPNRFISDNGDRDVQQPYDYLDNLQNVWNRTGGNVGSDSPFYNVDLLNNLIGWRDDRNQEIFVPVRGDGRGASGVLLFEGLRSIFSGQDYDDVLTYAANLIWRRNLTARDDAVGKVDQSGLSWNVSGVFNSQPGFADNGNEVDDAQGTRQEFFRFTDPLRLWDDSSKNGNNATVGDAKMIFPWRGKSTVDMDRPANSVRGFDYANTVFRSYDPLGEQIFTYLPKYSYNPYWAYQNVSTWQDSPYTLAMLERMLRPFDSDVATTPSQLVDDLGLNSDLYSSSVDWQTRENQERERARARQALTTISSDVPSPSLVFPENEPLDPGEYRGGQIGFVDLIRRCVRCELLRVFEEKKICEKVTDSDSGNEYYNYLGIDVRGNKYNQSVCEANTALFESKVEDITMYLVSLLPREIMAGEKIDLNALSQKNYWLDVDWGEVAGKPNQEGWVASESVGGRAMHNVGLVKRMEYARGLYLVMMTLLYEDMNAEDFYPKKEEAEGEDAEKKLSNYIEGSFDLLKYNGDKKKSQKSLIARELTATRIAQWCINVVDFSDPDATMTPFYFDPTPFDGWWVQDSEWIDNSDFVAKNGYNPWKVGEQIPSGETTFVNPGWGNNDDVEIHFLFSPNNGSPAEQMENFFLDALNNSEDSDDSQGNKYSVYLDYAGNENAERNEDGTIKSRKRSNKIIAEWMTKSVEKLEDQTSDLGFRVAWGMERPDLVLTETLNFHDLGIANTVYEGDDPDNTPKLRGAGADEDDDSFDQVKRPQGSTYLELYCTANPNVPQSPELYEYDTTSGLWRLYLSKTTPDYIDSLKRKTAMPVWRVAIGASSDPRGLSLEQSTEGKTGDDKTKVEEANKTLKNSNKVVYRKARNSVLEWLTPHKDGDDYEDDISFFSMQTRQFRNLPTQFQEGSGGTTVDKIGDLDIDQGLEDDGKKVKELDATKYLADWKPFNISASNLLGPVVASKEEDARTREIELDRIVWFIGVTSDKVGSHDSGNSDGAKLGTAGKNPDALRTFCKKDVNKEYLEPNQYLVVGPEKKRAIGSMPFNATTQSTSKAGKTTESVGRFGQNPPDTLTQAWLNLESLGEGSVTGNYKYIEVESIIGRRGLNISEPLWTADNKDPYPVFDVNKTGKDPKTAFSDGVKDVVFDIPFELPPDWAEGGRTGSYDYDSYPIIQDELFGLGTVPAYKSAFVQRVADPNRPYHPLMNPYITVDWNVMDLTIFTGDCVELGGAKTENTELFTTDEDYDFTDANKITLAKNDALDVAKDKKLTYDEVFSSRQWGNSDQKTFAPDVDKVRPNPWARAFEANGDKAGLQKPTDLTKLSAIANLATNNLVVPYVPKHTLGFFNNKGPRGTWNVTDGSFTENEAGSTYKGLNEDYLVNAGVYTCAPHTPFEHLVWNDAPFSNIIELALVPASAPGRFGLEFVRKKADFELSGLYKVDSKKKSSLGSFGVYGFTDWYNDNNIKVVTKGEDGKEENKDDKELKDLKDKAGAIGPYLNFFVSSKTPGETLNLCKALEFVHTPSWFLGTKTLAGLTQPVYDDVTEKWNRLLIDDANGNAEFRSKRREPGKININTAVESSWAAISPAWNDKLTGTPWDEINPDDTSGDGNGKRWVYAETSYYDDGTQITDDDGNPTTEETGTSCYCYFQPANALALWLQLDKTGAPDPAFATLLAQQKCNVDKSERASSSTYDALFDNVNSRYATDDNGNTLYSYKDESGQEQTTIDTDSLDRQGISYSPVKTERRNNLFEATAEMQRLSGLTTTRSNVFAAWVTVGYFEVERCQPGVNMPKQDPDGNDLTVAKLTDSSYKWYQYYQAIYPDGYTYGKELGSDFGETKRRRGFSIIDRSIPVDFRRGNSANYKDAVLLQRIIN